MKTRYSLLTFLLLGALAPLTAQQTVDFESFNLARDTFRNGSDGTNAPGGFRAGDALLPNTFTESDFGGFWSGWSISTKTDTLTQGFTNQYAAAPGHGAAESLTYAAAFGETNGLRLTGAAAGGTVRGMAITNGVYSAGSMREGDSFAKRFGGITGDDPDFFLLTIRGYLGGQPTADSVDFYLADYRFADNSRDYIVEDWTFVDLSALGNVDSLDFRLLSSDRGNFGNNTPNYFYVDDIQLDAAVSLRPRAAAPELLRPFPNPTADVVRLTDARFRNAAVTVYTADGRPVLHRRSGAAEVDLRQLPGGRYLIVATTAAGTRGAGWVVRR